MVRCMLAFFVIFGIESFAQAMEAQAARVSVFHRGETIEGEEFVAANEAVVDALSTLERPSGIMERIVYNCMVKSREIEPQVWRTSGSDPYTAYVTVNTVYSITGCARAD